jgi:hypothetical protein
MAWSEDGITWTRAAKPFGEHVPIAIGYGTQFLMVGGDGYAASSEDGVSWVVRAATTVFGASAMRAVAYNSGADVWVIVGQNGKIALGTRTNYVDATALEAEAQAPLAGEYNVYLAGGYFRLGAPPAGLITADVTQGAAASDRTAGQLFTDVLTLAGKTAADWSTGDVTALDTANDAVLGDWVNEERTCAEQLDRIAASVGAWWGVDRLGIYRIQQLTAPSGTPAAAFVAADMLRPLERIVPTDPGRGIPVFQTRVRWGRVGAVQEDLAGGVDAVHQALVSTEWREATATDAAVQTVHLLAPQTIADSLLTTEADAQDEADRRQTLRGVLRHCFTTTVRLDAETLLLDLGDVVTLTHARYGLAAGADFRILRVEPDARAGSLGLLVWG